MPSQKIALAGGELWADGVPRHLRRRGKRALGELGYAFMRSRVEDGQLHRSLLSLHRRQFLASPPAAEGIDAAAYGRALSRYRRLFGWDMWAQAAMAAEDLEMLVRAVDAWRAGADFFATYTSVDAAGAVFFDHDPAHWESELRRLLFANVPTNLDAMVGPAVAARIRAAADSSVIAAAADFAVVNRQIPRNVREALRRYKHGFIFFLPSVAAIPTDPIGIQRVGAAAANGGFLVWSADQTAILFTCTDAELDAAQRAVDHAGRLAQWLERWILLEAEGGRGWGVALYGAALTEPKSVLELRSLETALRHI